MEKLNKYEEVEIHEREAIFTVDRTPYIFQTELIVRQAKSKLKK